MSTRRSHGYFPGVPAGVLLFAAGTVLSVAHADVTSSGLGTVVNQPAAGVFDITGGTRPGGGTNLFHSFGDFSLDAGQSGNFINNSGLSTTNVIGRVTGGNPSNISGTIQTTGFPGANLYLMNPAGILFGPTAQLNVEGSFHATTADYIKLGSDGIFYADAANASVLSASPPSAFGFLSANPASIEVQTGGIDFDTFQPSALLQVPEGETLSLVGGNAPGSDIPGVSIGALDGSTPGYVLAPTGRVNLVSVASAGEATFDGVGFNVDGFAELGGVKVGPGSIVDGKEIFIRGGRLVIDDGVVLPGAFAFELSFVGLSPLPDGGQVNIKVADDVTIRGTSFEPLTFAAPGIFVYTGDPLGNSVSPEAKLPDVRIDAGSVSISGFAAIHAQRNAPDRSDEKTGNVEINTNKVTVGSGGSIVLINAIQGDGPSLTINAKEVDVSGDGSFSAFGFEGFAAQGLRNPAYPFSAIAAELITADSGNITINASDSLSVRGLGQVTTDSLNFGRAGDITINAGNVLVAGTGDPQSALIGSQSNFAGDSGNIVINVTGTTTVKDGARVTSASLGSGNAGNVTLSAGGPVTLSGADARIVGATFQPPDDQLNALFESVFFESFDSLRAEMGNPNASLMEVLAYLRDVRGLVPIPDLDLTPGDGGAITITTPELTMNAGTRIETSTGWEGNAGSVEGNVGSLFVNAGAEIRSRSGVEFLDGTAHVGPGDGGPININATDTISISGTDSTISSSTFGDGNGGDILLNAGKGVKILNGGRVAADSGGTLADQQFSGSGLAGNISITSGGSINMDNGTMSTRAVTSDGGNIALTAPEWVYLLNSDITTSVESGFGGGGNINIDPHFVILNQSNILANAFGGPGGNINIVADNFIISAQSRVDASSALGLNGTVNISSPDQEVAQELAVLPENFLDVTGLISDRCGTTADASSLVSAGPGGLTVDPDGYLPSFATATNAGYSGTVKSSGVISGKPWWALATEPSVLQLAQVTCTRR
jgi:filamentous hemagglutinin family protein